MSPRLQDPELVLQRLDLTIAQGVAKQFDLSGMLGRRYIAVDNPGSYWIHFPQIQGALSWVPPTTFGWIAPLPYPPPGQLQVNTIDLPVGYQLDTTNVAASASITIFGEFPQISLGVQQLISTKGAGVSSVIQASVFGVSPSSSDNTAALNAATAALPGGTGTIELPAGQLIFTGSPNFANTTGIMLRGMGGMSGGAATGTFLVYTPATGARFIDARGAIGFQLRDLFVECNNAAFVGIAVDLGKGTSASALFSTLGVQIFNAGTGAGAIGLNLDQAQGPTLTESSLTGGLITVQLGVASPTIGLVFNGVFLTYRAGCTSLMKGTFNGFAWNGGTVEGNTLNLTTTIFDFSVQAWAFGMKGVWMGDAGAGSTGTWFAFAGKGISMEGVELGMANTMTGVSLATVSGASIKGNLFGAGGGGVGIAIGAGCTNIDYEPNDYTGVTTPVTGVASSGVGLVKIDEQTVGVGGVASVTVPAAGNLPTRGRHLRVRCRVRSDFAAATVQFYIRFNGDNGANYDSQYVTATGVGANPTNTEQLAQTVGFLTPAIPGGTAVAGAWADVEVTIRDFGVVLRQVAKSKAAAHSADASGGNFQAEASAYWRTSAALTSFTLLPSAGNLIAGSEITTYLEE